MPITLRAPLVFCALIASWALAQEYPIAPYVDATQLDVEWPKHSHYKQPWRGYLETRSGDAFLRGIGINFNARDNEPLAVRLLAESGFKAARIEIGWSAVNWEETGLSDQDRIRRRLELCRENGIRPTVLLNAHHGVPCPVRFFERKLAADTTKDSRVVCLDSIADIVPKRTGLSNLTDYMAAQVFITGVDAETGECQLSKPLPKDLKAGDKVLLATLKYLPAHPVGTPEFDEMAAGWERYTRLVLAVIEQAGIDDFDIEIWNELSFGSAFIGTYGINHYYDPPTATFTGDFLHPDGHAWEIGRRTIEIVKQAAPRAQCIWGFSNTTFFHTPIEKLPPGLDGQSYHPYGTGTRELPAREQAPNEPWRCLEGFCPTMNMRMPEGWAQTFIQTESLTRLLNPEARTRHPEGTRRFRHYMTEHGVVPPECGVSDEQGAWELKAKCALRAFCFWLNKGVDVMHYYCAYDANAVGMGLLPPELPDLSADAEFDAVATLPMQVVRRLTNAFAGSEPVEALRQLGVQATALSQGRKVFEGKDPQPPLWERDLLTVLPFQLSADRFLIAAYVMTCDYTQPFEEQPYRLTIGNLPEACSAVSLYDPLTDEALPVEVTGIGGGVVTVELPVSDMPRLLMLTCAD